MSKLKFALFGLGRWGKNYFRILSDREDAELVSIVTGSSGNAEAVWQDVSIDCVIIATPLSTHFALAKRALMAGKQVLLEKPITANIKAARKLAQRTLNS